MKRILPAVILALLSHAALFALGPDALMKRPGKMKTNTVTVTMSYRKKPAPTPPVKKPPEIKKEKKIKVIKKTREPALIKQEKPDTEPVKEQETVEDKTGIEKESVEPESAAIEGNEGHEDGVGGSILIVVKEAVPLYRVNPAPAYPRMARKRGYHGHPFYSL